MPDASNVFVCRGGETSAYRLIWGRFANEDRREWGRGLAR